MLKLADRFGNRQELQLLRLYRFQGWPFGPWIGAEPRLTLPARGAPGEPVNVSFDDEGSAGGVPKAMRWALRGRGMGRRPPWACALATARVGVMLTEEGPAAILCLDMRELRKANRRRVGGDLKFGANGVDQTDAVLASGHDRPKEPVRFLIA